MAIPAVPGIGVHLPRRASKSDTQPEKAEKKCSRMLMVSASIGRSRLRATHRPRRERFFGAQHTRKRPRPGSNDPPDAANPDTPHRGERTTEPRSRRRTRYCRDHGIQPDNRARRHTAPQVPKERTASDFRSSHTRLCASTSPSQSSNSSTFREPSITAVRSSRSSTATATACAAGRLAPCHPSDQLSRSRTTCAPR